VVRDTVRNTRLRRQAHGKTWRLDGAICADSPPANPVTAVDRYDQIVASVIETVRRDITSARKLSRQLLAELVELQARRLMRMGSRRSQKASRLALQLRQSIGPVTWEGSSEAHDRGFSSTCSPPPTVECRYGPKVALTVRQHFAQLPCRRVGRSWR
jgi:hypothetical protein